MTREGLMQFEGCESSLLDNSEVVWRDGPAVTEELRVEEENEEEEEEEAT